MNIYMRVTLALLACCFSPQLSGQENDEKESVELKVIHDSIGVWDAKIEVWPQGEDSPSITFKGVETNRAYGKYWLSSDFDSEYSGQTVSVHSIVGYDAEKKQLVGTIIDAGKYSATMTGKYEPKTNTVHWTTKARTPNGQPLIQNTSITQKSKTERVLVLSMPTESKGEFKKFMVIEFTKRKKNSSSGSNKSKDEISK